MKWMNLYTGSDIKVVQKQDSTFFFCTSEWERSLDMLQKFELASDSKNTTRGKLGNFYYKTCLVTVNLQLILATTFRKLKL